MGASESPQCSDIAMLEHLDQFEFEFKCMNKVILHKKYIYDGILNFSGRQSEVDKLFESANKVWHPLLKFTYQTL